MNTLMIENMARRQENGTLSPNDKMDWVKIRDDGKALGEWLGTNGQIDDCPDDLKIDYIILTAARFFNMSFLELRESLDRNKWIQMALKMNAENPFRELMIREFDRLFAAGRSDCAGLYGQGSAESD